MRMEVYAALYDADLNEVEAVSARVIDESSYADLLNGNSIYFFGDGALKCQNVLTSDRAIFLNEEHISASSWGKLINEKFKAEDFEDLAYYEPYYYKDFRAGKPKSML